MWNNTHRSPHLDTVGVRFSLCMRPLLALWMTLTLGGLVACSGLAPSIAPTPTAPPLAEELVIGDWENDLPQSLLDRFTAEYGVKVRVDLYESQEQAVENMRAGPRYDVVVMESRLVAPLIQSGLLAELDRRSLPNLKNLSADFRDLAYDPGNSHSIPFSWGTTGLVVRSDLAEAPITRWADLWDPRYAGKTALWFGQPREVIGLTLKSLGYSANSETREELEAALARLLELRPTVVEIEDPNVHWPEVLADGQVVVAMGYANDMIAGRTLNPAVTFVLPAEGPLLWNDTFVVPANSPHQATAELFLDFMLRPEISAEFVNKASFATPNDAALPLVLPKIADEPAIFPPKESLGKAEPILPLSPAGEALYADIWQRFLAGRP